MRLKGIRAVGEGAFMQTPIHLKRSGDSYFHLNPLDAMFSLLASFIMFAVLIVLMLVPSAR